MDTSRDKPTGTDGNPYIWLRYTTQFSVSGRTHTIEMGVPVPVGASAELREQLIREAEIGMEQLTRRVEYRAAQIAQRNTRPPEPQRTQASATARPNQTPLPGENVRSSAAAPTTVGPGSNMSTPTPAREVPQPLSLHEKQSTTAPARQSGTVSMPVTPNLQGEANSNMKLSQFMQAIRESWGITPKQAMDLLNVKTLNGMNYRDALRKLQPLVEGNSRETPSAGVVNKATPPIQSKPAEERVRPQESLPTQGSQSKPPAGPRADVLYGPANIPVIPINDEMIREAPRKLYKFDEEDEELQEEKVEEDEERKVMARIKLDELKEVRGTSSASQARLTVLQNVLNQQISDQQLDYLIEQVWGVAGVKKLKVDQVEALISWAKEDYFVEEVEAVLALIDGEGSHARSDR
jgi:hypothetical protein